MMNTAYMQIIAVYKLSKSNSLLLSVNGRRRELMNRSSTVKLPRNQYKIAGNTLCSERAFGSSIG